MPEIPCQFTYSQGNLQITVGISGKYINVTVVVVGVITRTYRRSKTSLPDCKAILPGDVPNNWPDGTTFTIESCQ